MLRTEFLVAVLYSAGKVFDNLRSGRLATQAFLLADDDRGIASRADLQLLEDLKAAGHVAVRAKREQRIVDAQLVCAINAAMTRSAALHPGQLRKNEQKIGVRTKFGYHMPQALSFEELDALIAEQTDERSIENAARLFVEVAKAQPFEDGNKRTALLAANALLDQNEVLVAPHDPDHDAQSEGVGEIETTFHDLLARAYIFNEIDSVVRFICDFQTDIVLGS